VGNFDSNYDSVFSHKNDRNIGFQEERQSFRQKLAKIAINSDHNIEPVFELFYDFANETCAVVRSFICQVSSG
jgi:hypothetical protein